MTTPESGSPPTPESTSMPPLEKALRFGAVDGLWQRTKEIYYAHHTKENSYTPEDADLYNAEVAGAIAEYLRGHGLDETSDEATRLGSRLRMLAFDRMNTKRWKYGDWQKNPDRSFVLDAHGKKVLNPGTSGESRVRKLQLAFTGRDLEEEARVTAGTEGGADDETEKSTAEVELERRARAKYETYVNMLRGPVFLKPKKRKELREAYARAEQEYAEMLDAMSQKDLERWTQEGKTDDEVGQLLTEQTNRRNYEDVEAERRLLVEKSGWLGRQMERYANLGKLKKIGVTLGLGAIGLGVGFAGGWLLGGVGLVGGVIGAGGLTAGGSRLFGAARLYKLRQADLFKKQSNLQQFDHTKVGDGTNTPTPEGIRRASIDFLRSQSNAQVERAEKIKRRAVYWTMGSVAVGAVAGEAVHIVTADGWFSTDHLAGGQVQHWLADRGVRAPWDHTTETTTAPHPNEGMLPNERYPEGGAGPAGVEQQPNIDSHLYVDKGSGLIKETYQSANTAGYKIDMKTAEELYRATREHFGDRGIIDIDNIKNDTYLQGGDLRLSGPGKAVWKDGVADFMEKWLQEHGHGVHAASTTASAPSVTAPSGVVDASADHFTRMHDASVSMVDQGADHFTRMQDAQSAVSANSVSDAQTIKSLGGNVAAPGPVVTGTDQEIISSLGGNVNGGSGNTVSSALEQAINKGDALQMNIVDHTEGWFKTFDDLRAAGVVDIPKDQYSTFLKEIGPKLSEIHYSNGSPVAFYNRFAHQWWMYDSPDQKMPADAIRLIASYAAKDNYVVA